MASFTDNQKREWTFHVDIPLARQVRQELGVDILDIEQGLRRLAGDPILLCDVLYLLCRRQADERQVSDEDFGRALVGESLEQSCEAYFEALLSFSPPRQREILTTMQTAGRALEEALTGIATQKIPEAIQRMRSLTGGNSSPVGKESSASAPPAP